MNRSLSKKAQNVMHNMMEEAQVAYLASVSSKIKARMMFQAALEDTAGAA